jgi:hypothetical protein
LWKNSELIARFCLTDKLRGLFILIEELAKFQRNDHVISNKGGSKPGAQSKKQHPSAFIAAESLHRCIVNDSDRQTESSGKIKTHPAGS